MLLHKNGWMPISMWVDYYFSLKFVRVMEDINVVNIIFASQMIAFSFTTRKGVKGLYVTILIY